MVDFRKKLGGASLDHPLDPLKIYDGLDRATDKGELRDAQKFVLNQWHNDWRSKNDVIVKLHTGQGKTLIGLLILQSKLNENMGPALYICPDNFLAEQTAIQARQFGFDCEVIGAKDELPTKFIDAKSILITSVQKVFNGFTKFGLHSQSIQVGAIVIDDVHACINSIRQTCSIRLESGSEAYSEMVNMFGSALQSQGQGTYADLVNKGYDALLPVPYWDWIDRTADVAKTLSKHANSKEIKFAWPLLRDILSDCDCLISGASLEIFPRLPPLTDFGSYNNAKHRVFMSATVSDDSFLIRGMRISAETVRKPLTYAEKWSGEKMVLIPSLISGELDREVIVNKYGKGTKKERKFGVVVLTPSFKAAEDWKAKGAVVAESDTIHKEVERLRQGDCKMPLVIANRYDGIDLPDSACRILILDSKPLGESLYERYLERCLPNSDAVTVRVARTIEQGLGRSVRGEKDYSVILLIGANLVRFVRMPGSKAFLSAQTHQQIKVGTEVTGFIADEIQKGISPVQALVNVINQCLQRDDGWKAFYKEKMDEIADPGAIPKRLDIFALELMAEIAAQEGRYEDAAEVCQKICDEHAEDDSERGWYLQEMARHLYRLSKVRSEKKQTAAHRKNRFLLRPLTDVVTDQLPFAQRRVEKIIEWIKSHKDADALRVGVDTLLSDLRFGVDADTFEDAIHRLGEALGFSCERPDKEWKEGPDNLWRIRDNLCLVIECKSEVALTRIEIEKRETEQMDKSYAWFTKIYPGVKSQCVMIIPPKKLSKSAALLMPVFVLHERGLDKLKRNVRSFFKEFMPQDFQNLSEKNVGEALAKHELAVENIVASYTVPVQDAGLPR